MVIVNFVIKTKSLLLEVLFADNEDAGEKNPDDNIQAVPESQTRAFGKLTLSYIAHKTVLFGWQR